MSGQKQIRLKKLYRARNTIKFESSFAIARELMQFGEVYKELDGSRRFVLIVDSALDFDETLEKIKGDSVALYS